MEENEFATATVGIAAFGAALRRSESTYEMIDDTSLVVPAEGRFPLLITTITVTHERVMLETLYPFAAPADRCGRMMELAARLNIRLAVGAVTVDPDDGALAFRTSFPIQSHEITIALAAEALAQHWATANDVLPGLAVVAFTDFSLMRAIEQAEGTTPLAEALRNAVRRLDAE